MLIEEEVDIVSDTESKLSEFKHCLFIRLSITFYFPAPFQRVIERRGVNKPLIAAMDGNSATGNCNYS